MAQFDVEYDVVVVGSGGSGKSAAYTICSESDLSCAILEKLPMTGGSSLFAEGHCACESSEQIARGVPDYPKELPEGAHFPSYMELVNAYVKESHHRCNLDVVKAFAKNSAETIDIMKSLGVEYQEVGYYTVDEPDELFTFHRPVGMSLRCQEVLLSACENGGVDIFVSTPAKELIFEDGKIVGILATDADGNEMRIGAKAIILASGGFGDNLEKIGKYSWMPQLEQYNNMVGLPIQNTGDGLDMALSAGGDTFNIGTVMCGISPLGKMGGCHLYGAGTQPLLWVTSKGVRHCNEAVATSFANCGYTVGQQPDCSSYTIFDEENFLRLTEGTGSEIANGDFCPYGACLDHLKGEIEESLTAQDGAVFKADTIEGLAEQFGADPSVFRATVDRYNELCEKGVDEDFGKQSDFLHPITKPPFYAIHEQCGVLVTDGGIRVNGDMQVTNADYEPIEGLYAVGNDASGLYGDVYALNIPGSANGFAHTSGRIAARAAIKQIKG